MSSSVPTTERLPVKTLSINLCPSSLLPEVNQNPEKLHSPFPAPALSLVLRFKPFPIPGSSSLLTEASRVVREIRPFPLHPLLSLCEGFLLKIIRHSITFTSEKAQRIVVFSSKEITFQKVPLDRDSFVLVCLLFAVCHCYLRKCRRFRQSQILRVWWMRVWGCISYWTAFQYPGRSAADWPQPVLPAVCTEDSWLLSPRGKNPWGKHSVL